MPSLPRDFNITLSQKINGLEDYNVIKNGHKIYLCCAVTVFPNSLSLLDIPYQLSTELLINMTKCP